MMYTFINMTLKLMVLIWGMRPMYICDFDENKFQLVHISWI
jgi:hypothetical protein